VSEGTGGGRFAASVRGNLVDGIGRQALLVSARGSTDAMDVGVVGNRIGLGEPVATTGRRGVEVSAEDDAQLTVHVLANTVRADTSRDAVAILSADRSRLSAVLGGTGEGGNSITNLSTDDGSTAVRVDALDRSSLDISLDGNDADGVSGYLLRSAGGALTVRELPTAGSRNRGRVRVVGEVTAAAGDR
jgi:hypothetical protein